MTLIRTVSAAPETRVPETRPETGDDSDGTATGEAAVFADPQSRSLARLLKRIAPTNVPVMITGETGSGKEHLARYIHARSGRSGEFVVVQCGPLGAGRAAPEALSDGPSESLSRTPQGSFPGVVRGAGGRGTLFLDDVGDLSPALQGELLRILRDSESDPKASERAQLTRVRVIAASNIDLGEAANRGRFRHDLLYRLNIASVKVLPLRQRPGDIVPLAHHFLRLHSENGRLPVRVLGQDSVAALGHYPWPGNVRELENVIRFALLTATRRELSAVDLHLEHERASGPVIDRELSAQALDSTLDRLAGLLATLLQHPCARLYDKVEGLLIAEAYRATGGNQVHTATRLGISRNVVRTLLKKHGLLSPTRRHRP